MSEHSAGPTQVLVRHGRIVDVAARVDDRGADIIDLADRTLLPGFIDCHVHTTMDPSRIMDAVVSDPATVTALNALPTLKTLLHNGFTTVRDLGAFTAEPITIYLRNAVAARLLTGPRLVVAPHFISARGGHGDFSSLLDPQIGTELGALADGPVEIASLVRRDVRAGADWIKFGATGGFGSPSDDPGQALYSQDEMDTLVATARDLGVPCTPHAYGDEGISRALEAGVRSIEHGNLASAATLKSMEQYGVFLVPTQYMVIDAVNHLDDDTYWVGKSPAERKKFSRYEEQLRESARNVAASKVNVAFGTDAGMFPHAENWREFPTMVSTGITPLRALRAATSVAAGLLQRPDLGRIEAGATADLIALADDPFSDIEATGAVEFVMQSGIVHRALDSL
ncbi:metal-dependent hydrolase family protein [Nocardia nova]|uniref:metal-dependent hydrolase family protein n=1 Tax=Nocardia nova TaxID=37330 RepID=UPI001FEAF500|nr:amidohydrolase family protein [Nocardia nova]